MPEHVYNTRQDVFGCLAKMPRASLEIWYEILMRTLPDGQGAVGLPRKLWVDARKLVTAGIAIEPIVGRFAANPEVVFMSSEPTMEELLVETNSQRS